MLECVINVLLLDLRHNVQKPSATMNATSHLPSLCCPPLPLHHSPPSVPSSVSGDLTNLLLLSLSVLAIARVQEEGEYYNIGIPPEDEEEVERVRKKMKELDTSRDKVYNSCLSDPPSLPSFISCE